MTSSGRIYCAVSGGIFIPNLCAASRLYHRTVINSSPLSFRNLLISTGVVLCQIDSSDLFSAVTSSSSRSVSLAKSNRRLTASHGGPDFIVVLSLIGILSRLSHLPIPSGSTGSDFSDSDLGLALNFWSALFRITQPRPPSNSILQIYSCSSC